MRRALLVAAIAPAAVSAAGGRPAAAQAITHEEAESFRSPQHFALELRFGPWLPDVDSEFAGRQPPQHPFADYFGKSSRLMMQTELDWQLFRGFGSAAVGLGIGYTSISGKAFLSDDSGGKSADNTTLTLVPMSLSLVYRADQLARWKRIPIVPYGKLGLDYAYWSITDGNGNISKEEGGPGKGRGSTPGWHAAGGVSLLLDVFDPDAARSLDSEIGVNHTHLFFEYGFWDLSGFGDGKKLRLGDTTWFGGLLFEF